MQCTIPLDTDSINYTTSMDSETKQVSRLVLPARRLAAWFALGGGGQVVEPAHVPTCLLS